MSTRSTVQEALTKTRENISTRRYLQNYPNDIAAGNISRTPFYATIDNAVLGVDDGAVVGSVVNALVVSCAGWSLFYTFGNSMLSTTLGETYQKHAKKIDAVYSAAMTFGFGMAVNSAAGYDLEQAVAASTLRAMTAIPLGPLTRWYTDSFRNMRGEPSIAKETSFQDTGWKYKLPRLAAMVALPVALMTSTLATTPKDPAPSNTPTIPQGVEVSYERKPEYQPVDSVAQPLQYIVQE